MREPRPLASLSLDLDNQWSYMKTHGDAGWESLPSYLDIVVPRVLRLLKEKGLTITFFIVGLDADQERNHAVLRSIAEAGHEIGNHSFHHEPWLHLYSQEQLLTEITKAETAIADVTVMENSRVFSGNTKRASQLPFGSCCQFTKCSAGVTLSE